MSLLLVAGCVAPAMVATAGLSVAQTGAATWLEGDLVGTYNEEYADMVWACDAAAKQLALTTRVRRVDEELAYMYFEDDDGVDVDITLKRRTSRLCQITIRVGVWGNKPLSSLFLGVIEQQLKERHTEQRTPDMEPHKERDHVLTDRFLSRCGQPRPGACVPRL